MPPRLPAYARSALACEPDLEWIEGQVLLARNAMAIYQERVSSGHLSIRPISGKNGRRGSDLGTIRKGKALGEIVATSFDPASMV
ncbi:MAG: hypothetical protein M3Z54_10370 [Gemmatimonadota bacterium]|nr:hypothetical protein [Gemmatimonadota bacterium]